MLAVLPSVKDPNFLWKEVEDITELVQNEGFGEGDQVDIRNNFLDLSKGSQSRQHIEELLDRGVMVQYEPQRPL